MTETVTHALITGSIARFGMPYKITSDQGRQFVSTIFPQLTRLLGVQHLKSTAYHPQANGLIENWHRILKAAVMCYKDADWYGHLPTILLGLRSIFKPDIKATPAEMVYGTSLRLPGEFFVESPEVPNETDFVKTFRKTMLELKPEPTSRHGKDKVFVQIHLKDCEHVFIRNDTVRASLQPPYDGPFTVVKRFEKYFVVKIREKQVKVSIDRLKAAFITMD